MDWTSLDFHQLDLTDGWIITFLTTQAILLTQSGIEVQSFFFVFKPSLMHSPSCIDLQRTARVRNHFSLVFSYLMSEGRQKSPPGTGLQTHTVHLTAFISRSRLQNPQGGVYLALPFINIKYPVLSCSVFLLKPNRHLKVQIAYPVDNVEQQEGGGEKNTGVCVQFQ